MARQCITNLSQRRERKYRSKRRRHLPNIKTFFGQTDRQTDIVVHREGTLPKNVT